jgi:hypothetical protein
VLETKLNPSGNKAVWRKCSHAYLSVRKKPFREGGDGYNTKDSRLLCKPAYFEIRLIVTASRNHGIGFFKS